MNEKSPSITFQNRINNIKEGYEELGNLTIKLTGTVVRLLENYDETDFENIEECSTTIDIKTIEDQEFCIILIRKVIGKVILHDFTKKCLFNKQYKLEVKYKFELI